MLIILDEVMTLKIKLEEYFPPIPHDMEIFTFGYYIHYSTKYRSRLNSFKKVDEWCKACKFSDEEALIWILKFGQILPQRYDAVVGVVLT